MERIILAAMAVLLFTQTALAYTRLFYSVTVRVEADRCSAFMESNLPTDLPAESNLPTEEITAELVEEENIELAAGSVSAIIGPPEGVELIETSASDIPPSSAFPAQPSDPPVEEGVEEQSVGEGMPTEEREELAEVPEIIAEQSVENKIEPAEEPDEVGEMPTQEEKIQERTDESATPGEGTKHNNEQNN